MPNEQERIEGAHQRIDDIHDRVSDLEALAAQHAEARLASLAERADHPREVVRKMAEPLRKQWKALRKVFGEV